MSSEGKFRMESFVWTLCWVILRGAPCLVDVKRHYWTRHNFRDESLEGPRPYDSLSLAIVSAQIAPHFYPAICDSRAGSLLERKEVHLLVGQALMRFSHTKIHTVNTGLFDWPDYATISENFSRRLFVLKFVLKFDRPLFISDTRLKLGKMKYDYLLFVVRRKYMTATIFCIFIA